jgi:L-ascorbate metabolism protein UlaG (beta-lactamase superfamily)
MKWVMVVIAAVLVGLLGFVAFNTFTDSQDGPIQNMTDVEAPMTQAKITPISHATMVIEMGGQIVYVDPVGGADAFVDQPKPNIILVTDIHGDHFEPETLRAISQEKAIIVVPQAVADMLPENIPGTVNIMANGDKQDFNGISIQAVPMYNIPESAESFHVKGRGNGYVLQANDERVYIAGDTSAIPEMKALQNIDIAFIPMNLPYTMTVQEAADGVVTFKPKVVHPYHYRGEDGLADVDTFKELVNSADPNITVELLDFYPEE